MKLELFGRICESADFAKSILVQKGFLVVAAVTAMFSLPGVMQPSFAQSGLDGGATTTPVPADTAQEHLVRDLDLAKTRENELNQLIELAKASVKSQKWQEAKEQFVLASSKDPSNKIVLHELALIYEHEGMLGVAVVCERKALRLDANFVPAQLELAHIYSLFGSRTNVEGHLKISHHISPDNTGEFLKNTN